MSSLKKKLKVTTHSMTGYASVMEEDVRVLLDVEVRTVNSRYLDINLRLPRAYGEVETDVRAIIGEYINRGRVDVNVSRWPKDKHAYKVEFNGDLLKQTLIKITNSLGSGIDKGDIVSELIKRKEVLEFVEGHVNLEKEKKLLVKAVKSALHKVNISRLKEGEALGADILLRLSILEETSNEIEKLAAGVANQIMAKLHSRIANLVGDVNLDQGRLSQEVAMLADKADISEELVRLSSHFRQFREILGTSPNGRQLDFLTQEILREFNTISSKAQDAVVQGKVVRAKAEVEKIKEQLQNIE